MKRVTNYSYGDHEIYSHLPMLLSMLHGANFILEFQATKLKLHVQIWGLQQPKIPILTLIPIFAPTKS